MRARAPVGTCSPLFLVASRHECHDSRDSFVIRGARADAIAVSVPHVRTDDVNHDYHDDDDDDDVEEQRLDVADERQW